MDENKIHAMDPAKRERILNAAMGEFTKGFKHANTDAIAKQAGISKGLLFHYFGNKQELLGYLYRHAVERIMEDFLSQVDSEEPDILLRLEKMTRKKLELTTIYPTLFDFITALFTKPEEEFMPYHLELKKNYEEKGLLSGQWFKGYDKSLFKEEVDAKTAIEIISWTLAGYSESLIKRQVQGENYHQRKDEILIEFENYMDFFRKNFYKGDI